LFLSGGGGFFFGTGGRKFGGRVKVKIKHRKPIWKMANAYTEAAMTDTLRWTGATDQNELRYALKKAYIAGLEAGVRRQRKFASA
jgi:hypothetical protein